MSSVGATNNNRLRCFVIGSGAIVLRCTEIIRAAGRDLLGVYSFDDALLLWFDKEQVPHADSRADFQKILFKQSFDFLFSINNPWIIPAEVLQLKNV